MPPLRPVIILAAFGTSDPDALKDLLNIKAKVAAAWRGAETRLAFTSRILRNKWRLRAGQTSFRAFHSEVPSEIYEVKSPLVLLAEAQEEGPRPILVQPLHVSAGEEYADLRNMVAALAGLETLRPDQRPFPFLRLGLPALVDGEEKLLARVAKALGPLVEKARLSGSALVLMGHGSRRLASTVYGELEKHLRRKYAPVYIGLAEGGPGPRDILAALSAERSGCRKAFLAPLLIVAGEHAKKDLAGPGPESWAACFRAAGYEVETHLEGLGALDDWAAIFVEQVGQGLTALGYQEEI